MRYLSMSMAALIVCEALRASAQVYGPYANDPATALPGAPSVAGPAAIEGTGNPFLRRGPSRASQMQPGFQPAMPQSFASPQPQMSQQPPGQPQSAMSPRYDDQVQPASYDQPLAQPLPQVVAPQPAAPPNGAMPQPFVAPVDATPLAPPQQLHGVALLTASNPNEHPLAPVLRWADEAAQQVQGLRDYSCTFTKRERVDGRLQEQQVMYAKVRNQPYSVYLQFLFPNDVKGQEALYVDGRNQGRLLAHAVGFKAIAGTVSLAPTDPQAMDGNLHPITEFGIRNLVEKYREGLIRESQFGECNVRIVPGAQVGNRACTCIELTHPVRRAEFKYHLTRLYVDNELNLPIHYEGYDWPLQPGQAPPLVEDYTYQELRPNIGLSDADFDSKNPDYRF